MMWSTFLGLLRAPLFPDAEKTRRARALNALQINMALAILVLGVPGILFIFPEKVITSVILAIGVLVIGLSILLNRRGYVRGSGLVILVSLWAITVLIAILSGGVKSPDMMFFVSGTVAAGILLGAKGAYSYAGVSLLTGLGLAVAGQLGVQFPQVFTFPPVSAWIILFINLGFTVIPLQVALQTLAESVTRASASEERYRLIASVMSDYAFAVEFMPGGEVKEQWISGAFEAITGYEPEEFFARGGWLSLVHPEDRERDAQDMAQLRQNHKVVSQLRIIRKDGAVRWVRSYGHPQWDEKQNRLAGIYGAVQDISVQHEAEINLRQREAILEVVADAANTFLNIPEWRPAIWQTEIDRLLERLGTLIKASHAYVFEQHPLADGSPGLSLRYEWTAPGFTSDLGNPGFLNLPSDLAALGNDFGGWNQQIRSDRPYVGDARHINPQEMANLQARGIYALLDVPIYIEGNWWGIIGFDEMARPREWSNAEVGALTVAANLLGATVKRQQLDTLLQQELRQRKTLIDELERKNAELERFTYTVSHDLRSPLITIKGFLGYLEKDAAAGNRAAFQKDMERIGAAADRMDDLLRDLLELSRVGRVVHDTQPIPLADVVQNALELVHGRLEQRNIRVIVSPDLPTVQGDKPRLIEVLQNLIDNAAKYMGDQTEPLIEIGWAGIDEANHPILFVRDNGIGIDPQYHERIFGLFDKLDVSSEGTGVGLALVKRIIEYHGGRIWIESLGLGHGATFYFTLPISTVVPAQP